MNDHYDDTGLTGRAWFKPLLALWFGALAAAGMWFMPPDVHAAIARVTGLANVHPIFAAPIGRNAIIALCAAVGVLGAILGFLIAWKIAASSAQRGFAPGFEMYAEDGWAEEETPEEPRRRRVFSAREDIGEEGIAISAPDGEHDTEVEYESEYTLEDIPPVSPEEDFETVYAEMDTDYLPSEEISEADASDRVIEAETESRVEYAEFEDVDFEDVDELPEQAFEEPEAGSEAEPGPQAEPAAENQPLGDMSLDALVGRLGSALDQHRKLVAGSEEAAREPAPRTFPMTREPAPKDEETEPSAERALPEAAADDPVIAFLRREASRRMPEGRTDAPSPEAAEDTSESPASQTDAQAALRSALDRLGEANRRDS